MSPREARFPAAGRIRPRRLPSARFARSCAPLVLLVLGACANMGVAPWERDVHARADMAVSEQPLTDALEDHTFFSKEAASGGRSFGGGGCGCN